MSLSCSYPRFQQLDLTGPLEVLARFPELKIHLVWKTREPINDINGLKLVPTFADCPKAEVLFVPGGPGQIAPMEDTEALDFLRRQAEGARCVTSVCTGSLSPPPVSFRYRATCHWLSIEHLAFFGAAPVKQRVVIDRFGR